MESAGIWHIPADSTDSNHTFPLVKSTGLSTGQSPTDSTGQSPTDSTGQSPTESTGLVAN